MAKSFIELFIKKANVVHNDFYDYTLVNYVNSLTKVCIKCPLHNEFMQSPGNHIQGQGCPTCGHNNAGFIRRKTTEQFIKEANKVHNNFYDYSLVEYISRSENVRIICPVHNEEFLQSVGNHLQGKGCIKCGWDNSSKLQQKTTDWFIKKAQKKHGLKYDYSLVVYKNIKSKVYIKCLNHGPWLQSAAKHLCGQGCKKCASLKTTSEFIKDAKEVHGDFYNYSLVVYKSSREKVIIKCPKHDQFLQVPAKHIFGRGCPYCANNSISKKETNWLNEIGIPKKFRQYKINFDDYTYIIVDGCKPRKKIVFEFLGGYWHGDLRKYDKNDINGRNYKSFGQLHKETFARIRKLRKHGYTVIFMWEAELDKKHKLLKKKKKLLKKQNRRNKKINKKRNNKSKGKNNE